MLIVVKSKRFSVTGYKRMFVILIIKTLGPGFKYSTFDYCEYEIFLLKFANFWQGGVSWEQSAGFAFILL